MCSDTACSSGAVENALSRVSDRLSSGASLWPQKVGSDLRRNHENNGSCITRKGDADSNEPLLRENPDRFTIYPIR